MLRRSVISVVFFFPSISSAFSPIATNLINPVVATTQVTASGTSKKNYKQYTLFFSMAYSRGRKVGVGAPGGIVGAGGGIVPGAGVGHGGPTLELLELFDHQVTHELESSQLYLSASIWFDAHDFEGMAAYMLVESSKEREHALQLIDFANKRHFPIKLETLVAPNADWDDPEQVWQDVLKLEHENTNNLLLLAEAANKCHDFSVLAFLNPFHIEQVDSEDAIATILAKVHDETRTPGLLRQLDHELGLEAVAAGVVH
jgi:ferritin